MLQVMGRLNIPCPRKSAPDWTLHRACADSLIKLKMLSTVVILKKSNKQNFKQIVD